MSSKNNQRITSFKLIWGSPKPCPGELWHGKEKWTKYLEEQKAKREKSRLTPEEFKKEMEWLKEITMQQMLDEQRSEQIEKKLKSKFSGGYNKY